MKIDELKSILLKEAREKGICCEGYENLCQCADLDAILDFFTANPDWCLERSFPSWKVLDELLKSHNDELERHGIFIRRVFYGEELKDRQVYVFIGCKGKITTGLNIEKSIIPMMYFSRKCNMEIGRSDEASRYLNPPVVPLYIATENPTYQDCTIHPRVQFETVWFKRHYLKPAKV